MNKWFQDALLQFGMNPNEAQCQQFQEYLTFLLAQNQVMNLTAITDPLEVYRKHFYDSLALSQVVDLNHKTLLDVGAGAGFPSVPCKIMVPTLEVHIVDSLQKRISFLHQLFQKLRLSRIQATHQRVEDLPLETQYDLVASRAVSRLNILVELCLPFVKVGGYCLAMKSIHYHDELQESKKAIALLGGQLERIFEYDLSETERHVILVIRKVKESPKQYPRSFAKIKASPL